MGLFRRLAGFLGLHKDDVDADADADADESRYDDQDYRTSAPFAAATHQFGPRKGFSVPVQVAVDRPTLGPVIVPCVSGDGGVQGFKWLGKRLRIDEDGDVADEFLNEIIPEESSFSVEEEPHQHKPSPSRFEVNYSTKPVKIKNHLHSLDGKIEVEFQGRLVWI